jgi:hypothetical protein
MPNKRWHNAISLARKFSKQLRAIRGEEMICMLGFLHTEAHL